MTKQQLEEVVNDLVEIVDSWNDAAADGDRGRRNDALVLTLYDDGSGMLGRRISRTSPVEDFHEFNDLDQLAAILWDEGVEMEGDDV